MVRYLSTDWIDRLRDVASADDGLRELVAQREMTLQQIVTAAPDGERAYAITLDHGEVHVQAGRVRDPDVTFEQSWATAVGVATGELSAADAFRDGLIELSGDADVLTANRDVFGALDGVFGAVRSETVYE